jgi:hypothetical protein
MTPRPLWRWWLYCAVLALWFRFGWRWTLAAQGWCVLPRWLGAEALPNDAPGEEVPF